MRSQARTIASAFCAGRWPRRLLARAAACLTSASARTNSGKCPTGTPVMGKFSTARSVWMPQYASAGTSRSPRRSCSRRVAPLVSSTVRVVATATLSGGGSGAGCVPPLASAFMIAPPMRPPVIAYCCGKGEDARVPPEPESPMRIPRALICLAALSAVFLAALPPARAAIDLGEARLLIVKYRNQWLADPDKIRDARIGEIYEIPFVGTAVCLAVDRPLATGGYTGLEPLLVIIDKIDVTP